MLAKLQRLGSQNMNVNGIFIWFIVIGLLALWAAPIRADEGKILRTIQSPTLDAQKAYVTGKIEFRGLIFEGGELTPGLSKKQLTVVKKTGYKIKLLNEYKLYDKQRVESEYLVRMMKVYCNRYNQQMVKMVTADGAIEGF